MERLDTSDDVMENAGGRNGLVADRRSTITGLLAPAIGWTVGLVIMAWPTFSTAFRKVQGGLGDSRLVNFSLEHGYRWLMGMPLAKDLWSPPIFYPVTGTATYTDLMLGLGPFYWPWRWLGCTPHTAFQLWMLVCWSINFIGSYLLLRRGLRLAPVAATVGGYLFAFGSPRWMSMAHQQLVPQVWLLLSLAGLILIFRKPSRPSPARRWGASIAFWTGMVAQLYSAVYLLAFFGLGLAVAGGFALISRGWRSATLSALKENLAPLVITGVIAVALATPLTLRYHETSKIIGLHGRAGVHLPEPLSWVLPGNSNRMYGRIQQSWDLAEYRGFSQTNGVGVVTLVLCAAGLWIGRRRPEVRLVVVAFAGLVLLTITLPGGWSPWWLVRKYAPGYAALRAVARIGLMGLFPAALGVALAVERLLSSRRWIVVAALIAVVAVEQPHRRPSFDKAAVIERVKRIASHIPPDAATFLLVNDGPTWDKYLHDDAAWVALATGIPTVNGRYGHLPPAYPFQTPRIEEPEERAALRRTLDDWLSDGGVEPVTAAMIEVTPRTQKRRRPRRP